MGASGDVVIASAAAVPASQNRNRQNEPRHWGQAATTGTPKASHVRAWRNP